MTKNIIVYRTPTCVYCKMLEDFLNKNNVSYTEHDVSVDLNAREEMKQKSQQSGVPVVDVNGEIFVGFNRSELSQVLGLTK